MSTTAAPPTAGMKEVRGLRPQTHQLLSCWLLHVRPSVSIRPVALFCLKHPVAVGLVLTCRSCKGDVIFTVYELQVAFI